MQPEFLVHDLLNIQAARTEFRNFVTSTFRQAEFSPTATARPTAPARCRAGLGGATLHVGDVRRDLQRALRSLLDVAGDFLGRSALLFHRRRDRRGDLGHPADGVADLLDGTDRIPASPPGCRKSAGRFHRSPWPSVRPAPSLRKPRPRKPRPASPARAASMVAFSARRLVWPAMLLISSTTSPMRPAACASSLTRSLVLRA